MGKRSQQISNVYEFQQEKYRRSNVTIAVGKDEAAEFNRSDDEGEIDRVKVKLIGENKDDERVDSDDDEDIDSDAAFGESDEETFAGYGFQRQKKSKKKSKVRFADVDLGEDDVIDISENESEDDDDEEEGDPNEFVDVLDILDGRAKLQDDSNDNSVHLSNEKNVDTDDSEEDSGGSEEEQLVPSGEEDENSDALDNLDMFISNLETAPKRKASEVTDLDNSRLKKRKLLKERTEGGVESEFAAGISYKQQRLNLDDLLAPLSNQSSALLALKKSTKILSSAKGKALSAPLSQRMQERLDREAAYEQTKEEIDKWHATMKQIKEADHLSFPLQAQKTSQVSSLELVAKFKPTTALETSVDRLLKKANMVDSSIQEAEELRMNHLSLEEVKARRAELRKMRDLLFRTEIKAKRLSKIKSKTYRRLKKKGKQKLMDKLGSDEDENEEKKIKKEVERAKERATLKHKNTGKWAKAMKARGELDEDQKNDMLEMFERGEALRKKIRGDNDDDEDSDDDEMDPDQVKANAFEEISQLRDDDDVELPDSSKGKSIFEMKFMKNAAERENQKVQRIADDFFKEIGTISDEESQPTEREFSNAAIQRIGGRVTYRPGASAPAMHFPLLPTGSLASDSSSVTLQSIDFPPDPAKSPLSKHPSSSDIIRSSLIHPDSSTNPWLTVGETRSGGRAPRKKNEVVVGRSIGDAEKSKNKLRKNQQKTEEERSKAREEATVDISMNEVLNINFPSSRQDKDEESDVNSELEEQENALVLKKKKKGNGQGAKPFQQRDLVALAFAGDNVVQDFQEAKQHEIQEDAPHEVDTTLPGWGSWGGAGTRPSAPKPHLIKKISGVDPKSREDYNKPHVIISEKRDKKAAKYMFKDLPYPYTSRAQFERSLSTPVGTEWNTRVGFQRGTLPRIVKKPGVVIDPLEKIL